MNNMKKYNLIPRKIDLTLNRARLLVLSLTVTLLFTSCEKWFDVTPTSEMRGSQHFDNVLGFRQSLTGCYIAMAHEKAYGKNLTWFATELMGHQVQNKINPLSSALSAHAYDKNEVIPVVEEIWSQLANVIANANDGLYNLEQKQKDLSPIDYAVLRGEFLAVRAYVHFDLLRLYGYGNYGKRSTELDAKKTVPYITRVHKDMASQVTGAEFYAALIKDIKEAEELLKPNDPVSAEKDLSYISEVNAEGFYKFRDLHLNYFAVKALEARVHLWFGTPDAMDKALEAAKEVIAFVEKGKGYKEPKLQTEIKLLELREINDKNYSMTQEALFALQVQDLGSKTSQYYVPSFVGTHGSALTIPESRIKELYTDLSSKDVRMTKLLIRNQNTSPISYISMKYDQSSLSNTNKGRVNLIRIPEVYYIAAEASLYKGDTSESIEFLNKVLAKRGNKALGNELDKEKILEEIKKEYEKEFVAEGVLFFQYKRWGTGKLPLSKEAETMTSKEYVLPFPEIEKKSGYVQ
ncbi:hypothetical protein IX332_001182 [Porphyromonas levii]|nr:hypothetical protein [Porphyromonas levii]MBR8731711.1 hypothetical protein [Porphyromonas levii]MBR8760454.1 hypothetical protein [Porphyromonas levii]MBR8764487.1 hypothetical protein [Porphyromonas levii]MBR8770027.1 hypothetical protein [Porphyromonas levii]